MRAESRSAHTEHEPSSKCEMAPEANRTISSTRKYTCPMHPEVLSDKPGACPICGMALEPMAPSAVTDDHDELDDLTRRFWIGALLTLPVVFLSMGEMVPGLRQTIANVGERTSLLIQFALSTPVMLWAGWPFLEKAWR